MPGASPPAFPLVFYFPPSLPTVNAKGASSEFISLNSCSESMSSNSLEKPKDEWISIGLIGIINEVNNGKNRQD
jgi:hypothetical protein